MFQDVEAKKKDFCLKVFCECYTYNQENIVEKCAHPPLFFSSILSQEDHEWFCHCHHMKQISVCINGIRFNLCPSETFDLCFVGDFLALILLW